METTPYGFIEETDGKIFEYTVIDRRSMRSVGKIYNTKEEVRQEVARLTKELYKGSGVLGNEI